MKRERAEREKREVQRQAQNISFPVYPPFSIFPRVLDELFHFTNLNFGNLWYLESLRLQSRPLTHSEIQLSTCTIMPGEDPDVNDNEEFLDPTAIEALKEEITKSEQDLEA